MSRCKRQPSLPPERYLSAPRGLQVLEAVPRGEVGVGGGEQVARRGRPSRLGRGVDALGDNRVTLSISVFACDR